MEKYVYVLWCGSPKPFGGRDRVAVCTTLAKCYEFARKDGATEEQLESLRTYGRDDYGDEEGNYYILEWVELDEAA